jgi:hypothetical protein
VSTVSLGLGRIADCPIELAGEAATPADPVGPRRLSATVDFILVAAGSAAVLSPFVIVFAIMNLRALEPTGVLPIGILACLVVPSLLVFRYGTLGEVASAQAGFPPRVIAEAPPSAPLWMRAVAFASDISAYIALGVLMADPPQPRPRGVGTPPRAHRQRAADRSRVRARGRGRDTLRRVATRGRGALAGGQLSDRRVPGAHQRPRRGASVRDAVLLRRKSP